MIGKIHKSPHQIANIHHKQELRNFSLCNYLLNNLKKTRLAVLELAHFKVTTSCEFYKITTVDFMLPRERS